MDLRREARCHRCGTRLAQDNVRGYCSPCQTATRDRFADPPDLPTGFWDSEAMLEALRSRHMGRVIRVYRCHPFHGRRPLPQGVVAAWMGISQCQLSRIENGPPIVHLDRLIYWARLLRIPSSCLWFTLPEDEQELMPHARLPFPVGDPPTPASVEDVDASLWWAPADIIDVVSHFTKKDLTLDRREMTRAVASVIFGGALLEPLERWLSGGTEEPFSGRPGGIGCHEVGQIEHAARLFRSWDDQFGGGLLRKAVIGQLNEVAFALRAFHPKPLRGRLFGVMAQLAETIAIMSWDSGQQALAQRYYILAFRATKGAGDRAFGANVLAGMSRQLLYLGHANDALELVRLAQDHSAGYATASIRAMLHTREAWAYAKQGRILAFRRATAKAEDALAEVQPTAEPYWIGYFDRAELSGTTGGRLLELAHDRPELAAETAGHIQHAIATRRPGRLRSAALDQIGLAEARLVQGELEEAARLGQLAAGVVEQTPSDRVRVKLNKLYRYTTAYAHVQAIASLRDRVRPLLKS